MFPLIETIRFRKGRAENLEYHERRRIKTLRELFNVAPKESLEEILDDTSLYRERDKLFKLTLEYDAHDYELHVHSYYPKKIKTLRMVESDITYSYKWKNREALTQLLSGREQEDVVIVKEGWITDASFANLAFKKNENWYTPQRCLLPGTMRQYLLDENKIQAIPIHCNDLAQFSHVRLINAMLRFASVPLPISQIIPLP